MKISAHNHVKGL